MINGLVCRIRVEIFTILEEVVRVPMMTVLLCASRTNEVRERFSNDLHIGFAKEPHAQAENVRRTHISDYSLHRHSSGLVYPAEAVDSPSVRTIRARLIASSWRIFHSRNPRRR